MRLYALILTSLTISILMETITSLQSVLFVILEIYYSVEQLVPRTSTSPR